MPSPKLLYIFFAHTQELVDVLSAKDIEEQYDISLRNVYNAVEFKREFNGYKISNTDEYPTGKIVQRKDNTFRKRHKKKPAADGFFDVYEFCDWITGGDPQADY